MLINGEQVADMPGFMNMDMNNVLNIGYNRSLHRRRKGGEEKKKEKEQQSWEERPRETDFISPHRNGKGQSEAGNQMHHVPRPCFTYWT